MEAGSNCDVETYFKKIKIYQELRQTDVGRVEGGIH
jgi:hypothetical protein